MDKTNLLYNGNLDKGADGWTGNGLTVTNNELTVTGDLRNTHMIPVANGRKYRLTFDVKFNTIGSGKNFYIALWPYDVNHTFIDVVRVNRIANTNTTLAADLVNGATTVSLTSGANWVSSANSTIGICDLKAYGYNRCRTWQKFSSVSSNTLTLAAAWSGGTIASGTQVAQFNYGNTYYYPWYLNGTDSNKPTTWTTISFEFNGGDSIRYSCKYFQFATLGYTHNYSMRNIRIECVSDYQEAVDEYSIVSPQFERNGTVDALEYIETGMDIRYIRDIINGSTANTGNHWNEIQVFNNVGENIAWGKDIKIGTTNYPNSVATDGVVDSQWRENGTQTTMVLDLGFIEHINVIKIWHYYPDGRTYYNNTTEVSSDGTNWFTVYSGQKKETPDGNIINLSQPTMSIKKNGNINVCDIIEW